MFFVFVGFPSSRYLHCSLPMDHHTPAPHTQFVYTFHAYRPSVEIGERPESRTICVSAAAGADVDDDAVRSNDLFADNFSTQTHIVRSFVRLSSAKREKRPICSSN